MQEYLVINDGILVDPYSTDALIKLNQEIKLDCSLSIITDDIDPKINDLDIALSDFFIKLKKSISSYSVLDRISKIYELCLLSGYGSTLEIISTRLNSLYMLLDGYAAIVIAELFSNIDNDELIQRISALDDSGLILFAINFIFLNCSKLSIYDTRHKSLFNRVSSRLLIPSITAVMSDLENNIFSSAKYLMSLDLKSNNHAFKDALIKKAILSSVLTYIGVSAAIKYNVIILIALADNLSVLASYNGLLGNNIDNIKEVSDLSNKVVGGCDVSRLVVFIWYILNSYKEAKDIDKSYIYEVLSCVNYFISDELLNSENAVKKSVYSRVNNKYIMRTFKGALALFDYSECIRFEQDIALSINKMNNQDSILFVKRMAEKASCSSHIALIDLSNNLSIKQVLEYLNNIELNLRNRNFYFVFKTGNLCLSLKFASNIWSLFDIRHGVMLKGSNIELLINSILCASMSIYDSNALSAIDNLYFEEYIKIDRYKIKKLAVSVYQIEDGDTEVFEDISQLMIKLIQALELSNSRVFRAIYPAADVLDISADTSLVNSSSSLYMHNNDELLRLEVDLSWAKINQEPSINEVYDLLCFKANSFTRINRKLRLVVLLKMLIETKMNSYIIVNILKAINIEILINGKELLLSELRKLKRHYYYMGEDFDSIVDRICSFASST